jgi:predicted ATPase
MGPERQKERTLATLADQLAKLAAAKPLLLIVEDVHWIDPTTLESIDLIIGRAETMRILVVVTYRPEFQAKWVGRPNVSLLALNRLSKRQGATMVEGVTGGRALPPEILEQVVAKTDGVPLFVEELTRMVLESGLLREEDGRYVLDGPLPPLAIPATLHDSLMARLDRLAPAKDVAQTAAAIGRTFARDLLAAAVTMEPGKLNAALDQLVEAGLVFRQGQGAEASYTFKHALVQDTAYASLLKSQRQRLHARIANVLETQLVTRAEAAPEVVARHFAEAGLADQAVRWWRKAANAAVSRAAFEEAGAHLDAAQALLSAMDDAPRRQRDEAGVAITRAQVSLMRNGYAHERTRALYAEADRLAQGADDSRLILLARYGVWAHHHVGEEVRAALDIAAQMLDAANRRQDLDLTVFAHRKLGCSLTMAGRFDEACDVFENARVLYDPARHQALGLGMGTDPLVAINCYQSLAELARGYPERAAAMANAAQDIIAGVSLVNAKAYTIYHCAVLAVMMRASTDAANLAIELATVSDTYGMAFWAATAKAIEACCMLDGDDARRAPEAIAASIAALKATGSRLFGAYFLSLLAEAQARNHDTAAIATSREAEAQAERSGAFFSLAEIQRRQGLVLNLLRPAAADEAEAAFQRALATARSQNAHLWELRAATSLAGSWAKRGERQRAHDLLAPIHGWFTEGFDTLDVTEAGALLETLT